MTLTWSFKETMLERTREPKGSWEQWQALDVWLFTNSREAGLLSSHCKSQGQKQEQQSRVSDIPTGPVGWCLCRPLRRGRRSALEVISVTVMVSVRSLPHQTVPVLLQRPGLQGQGNQRGQNLQHVRSPRAICFEARKEGGEAGNVPVCWVPLVNIWQQWWHHLKCVFRAQESLSGPAQGGSGREPWPQGSLVRKGQTGNKGVNSRECKSICSSSQTCLQDTRGSIPTAPGPQAVCRLVFAADTKGARAPRAGRRDAVPSSQRSRLPCWS